MADTPAALAGPVRGAPLLEAALLASVVIHAVAMMSMTLLLPGLPGGVYSEVAARAAYVAGHPWLWRLGWLPWQLTAASDLLLGIALIATPWIPKWGAVLAATVTLAAIVPDQTAQLLWTWEGVAVAQSAASSGNPSAYLTFETRTFSLTAGWGAAGYTIAALAWTWCFAAAGVWSKALSRLSFAVWGVFALATSSVFLPAEVRKSAVAAFSVSLGNAIAFVLLMAWLIGVYEMVLRRSQPVTEFGGNARWRYPFRRVWTPLVEVLANSRALRGFGQLLPSMSMSSDISDVVYVNYLTDADELAQFVPHPLEIQRLGPQGQFAMLSFLTFRHCHFGPTVFGPLRWLWPSPVQSNWRLYVTNPTTGRRGVQFLTTAITSLPHALAARVLAEGVPMHVPASAQVRRLPGAVISVVIDPGTGTAPDVIANLAPAPIPILVGTWLTCFASWDELLAYCVPQDLALCVVPSSGKVLRQEINLGIPPGACKPLSGPVTSRLATALVGPASPICFVVDAVRFRFDRERTEH